MSKAIQRRYGRIIIVAPEDEMDIALYSSTPTYFCVADEVDEHVQSLRDELAKSKAEASHLADLLTDDKSAQEGLKELRDQLEEAKALLDAVEPNGPGGEIYLKSIDFDEWVRRCDSL